MKSDRPEMTFKDRPPSKDNKFGQSVILNLNAPEIKVELFESCQVEDDGASVSPPRYPQGPLTADRTIILV